VSGGLAVAPAGVLQLSSSTYSVNESAGTADNYRDATGRDRRLCFLQCQHHARQRDITG
jgi:hypothetical protein